MSPFGFLKKSQSEIAEREKADRGFLVFENTSEVIQAENVAKMSGWSEAYDLFTPDIGELAFLADEVAPPPFYTRGFILHEENHVPDLITRAYAHGNAPRYLLVKGIKDYVANREGVQDCIDHPIEESMEVIGGTGDTLTGIVAALSAAGMNIQEAADLAARTNRLAGSYAHPTLATQVMEIIQCIPEAPKNSYKGRLMEDKRALRLTETVKGAG